MNPLYQFDLDAFRAIHVTMHRDWLDPVMSVITDSGRGEIKFTILLVLCFLVRYRPYASLALVSGAVAGLFGQLVKTLVVRDRPGQLSWSHPLPSYLDSLFGQHAPIGHNSFPSGHAVSSFAIAVALAWCFRKTEHAWIGWVAIVWACLVGFSRVYMGVHFLSDVIGGAAVGAAFGTLFWLVWRRKGWVEGGKLKDEGRRMKDEG
jgi:undecaprenyl-diphosphatase